MEDPIHPVTLGLRFYNRRPLCVLRTPSTQLHDIGYARDPRPTTQRTLFPSSRDLYSFALVAILLAFHLAPTAQATPHGNAAVPDDALALVVGGLLLVFLGGAFLGFLAACAYLWRLATVTEAAATDRFAHVLAWLFGTTDDIQTMVADIVTTGGDRLQTLRDELAQLRKEMHRG